MSQVSSLHTKAKCYNFSVFLRKHKRHLCRNVWTQSKQRKCITTAAFAEKKQNCCSITKSNETVKTSFDVSISIFSQFFKRRLEQQQQKFKIELSMLLFNSISPLKKYYRCCNFELHFSIISFRLRDRRIYIDLIYYKLPAKVRPWIMRQMKVGCSAEEKRKEITEAFAVRIAQLRHR